MATLPASSDPIDDTKRNVKPWLAEDADMLIVEAARFLEAADSALAAALLEDDHDGLVIAAGHAIVCHARVCRFMSAATHMDMAVV